MGLGLLQGFRSDVRSGNRVKPWYSDQSWQPINYLFYRNIVSAKNNFTVQIGDVILPFSLDGKR